MQPVETYFVLYILSAAAKTLHGYECGALSLHTPRCNCWHLLLHEFITTRLLKGNNGSKRQTVCKSDTFSSNLSQFEVYVDKYTFGMVTDGYQKKLQSVKFKDAICCGGRW